jgi:hypothetical protein
MRKDPLSTRDDDATPFPAEKGVARFTSEYEP